MPKISVIIPIYDVEKYLDKCVESVVNQTYKDLEIILVDDGSPDNCPAICDEWAKKDSRIVVLHKQNGGLSSARNAGLDIATGEFVGFVDSDDVILPKMYESLFNAINKNSADMSLCGFLNVDEALNPINENEQNCPIETEVLDTYGVMEKLCVGKRYWYFTTSVNRLYRASIFKTIRFPDGMLHEDEFTSHRFFDSCKKVACIEDCLYLYVQREKSITTSAYNIKRLDAMYAYWDRYVLCKEKYQEFVKRQLFVMLGLFRKGLKNIPYRKWPKRYRKISGKMIKSFIKEREFNNAINSILLIIKYFFKEKKSL